ncbi:MAG: hypothetical protein ACI9FN_003325, partial [Saprospiraceae bacterium]
CFPPALFAEYLLGVEVVKPGMTEIIISMRKTALKDIQGVIPTPQGELVVNWDFENGVLMLDVPSKVIIKVDKESIEREASGQIKVNGKNLSKEDKMGKYILVSIGKHQVIF